MHNAPNPPKEARSGLLNLSLTKTERVELDRLAAEESARRGRPVTVSEYIRLRTGVQADRAA